MPDKPKTKHEPTHCIEPDCAGEPVADTMMCAEHLAELERMNRLWWAEMDHRVDERRGK